MNASDLICAAACWCKSTAPYQGGDHCTVPFANDENMLYQRRAILRAEQSWDNPDTPEKLDPAKISSVQYVKRQLDEVQRRLLAQEGTVVRMVIDHPHYIAQAVLTAETLSAIMPDPE